jgi:hypothetical protein
MIMAKRDDRWQIWKIALTAAACAVVSVVMFWLSTVAEPAEVVTDENEPVPLLTVPSFLQMLGAAVAILTILAVVWLVYRIRESRIPVWERKKPRKRRRRRR